MAVKKISDISGAIACIEDKVGNTKVINVGKEGKIRFRCFMLKEVSSNIYRIDIIFK